MVVVVVQFDQIMKIIEILGMPPNHMLDEAPKTKKFFDRLPDGSYIVKKSRDGKKVKIFHKLKTFHKSFTCAVACTSLCAFRLGISYCQLLGKRWWFHISLVLNEILCNVMSF